MSYLVLARKWRPRSFETLIGQDHVVRALTHALSSGRLHHAWLFTGTRGVGKTTLSRILAKSLNCAEGVTAAPCGHCQACTEIDAGRFVDYIELDAASNRGVDEMTQLLEQAVYAPSSGRYKVYMIDEVHMLTGHAFNAMLKTLEEPPEHVKFILATTDPQKIPVTVLSRCLQFNLKQMTVPAMVEHLSHILTEESVSAEPQALRLIAQAAAGSMRDALSLTDQAISFAAGPLTASVVGEMLGTLDQHYLVALLRVLAAADTPGILAIADEISQRGLSFRSALADLAVLLSRVAIAQRLGHAQPDDPLAEDIQALAGALSPDDVQLFYAVAVHSRQELALAPDEYAGFVMACLRMLALLPADRAPLPPLTRERPDSTPAANVVPSSGAGPDVSAPSMDQTVSSGDGAVPSVDQATSSGDGADALVAAAVESASEAAVRPPVTAASLDAHADGARAQTAQADAAVESQALSAGAAGPADGVPDETPENPSAVAENAVAIAVNEDDAPSLPDDDGWVRTDAPVGDWTDDIPAPVDDLDDRALIESSMMDGMAGGDRFGAALPGSRALPAATAAGDTAGHPDPADMTPAQWPAVAASLPATGAARALALNSEWLSGDDHVIRLRIAIHTLTEGGGYDRLRTILSEYYGRALRLDVEYGDTGDDTAHAVNQAEQARRQRAAEQAAAEDELVHALGRQFEARIVPGSVRPPAV